MKNNVFILLTALSFTGSLIAPALADDWHHRADLNHDGRVDYHEWSDYNGHHPGIPKREWRHRFDSYDHDHDGYLAPGEVVNIKL